MANLIPIEVRRRESLLRVAGVWTAVLAVVAAGLAYALTDSSRRADAAERTLRQEKKAYDGLEQLIHASRRLVSQRNQLFHKQRAIEALRRDQRSTGALADLAGISGEAIWFQKVRVSEVEPPKAAAERTSRGSSPFGVPKSTAGAAPAAPRSRPLAVVIDGFAFSQQELAEFFSRLEAHERFAEVELRYSSRTSFLKGEAVKFVIAGSYR